MAYVNEKEEVEAVYERVCPYDIFDTTIDGAIKELQDNKDEMVAAGYTNIRVEYVYDDAVEFSGTRLETDKEFNARKKKHEAVEKGKATKKAKKEEKDCREYERLKKKYGDG